MTFNELEPIEDCVNPDSYGELCLHCGKCGRFDGDKEEDYDLTCKADDVLDKIKAEIEDQVLESLSDDGDDWFAAEKVNECLDIIDKYRNKVR